MPVVRFVCLGLIALFGVGPSLTAAQSLGSVAKKERARREKNKAEGVEVQEFTEEEVFGPEGEASGPEEGSSPVATSPGDENDDDALGFFEEPTARSDDDGPADDWERESRERRRNEAEWRAGVQRARDRIASARERREWLDGLNLSAGESYVDAQGNPVIHSLEELRRMVREADEELAEAEAALEGVMEDARRAGVPPGWLR